VSRNQRILEVLIAIFHAQGEFRTGLPAEFRIGDPVVMVSGGDGRDPEIRSPLGKSG
jgi:PhnB protein